MTQLTEEALERILDKRLEGLATKEDIKGMATNAYLKKEISAAVAPLASKADLQATELRLISRIDESQSELARITSAGFDRVEKDHEGLARMVKNGFDDAMENLGVRKRLLIMETQVHKINMALNLEV